jgi:plastocyanin
MMRRNRRIVLNNAQGAGAFRVSIGIEFEWESELHVSMRWWGAAVACAAFACGAGAAQVTVMIEDAAAAPVHDAVVALLPAAGVAPPATPKPPVALDQVKKQFVPHVLAIEVGTTLYFPNSDNIRHQVYSFSEAKRFELKLYSGKSAAPVLFDQAGVVVLGCNIHDWMSAYVYVVPTPYFAMTDKDGRAVIKAPPGKYTVKIWHPRYAHGREAVSLQFDVAHDTEPLQQTLALAAEDDSPGVPPEHQ